MTIICCCVRWTVNCAARRAAAKDRGAYPSLLAKSEMRLADFEMRQAKVDLDLTALRWKETLRITKGLVEEICREYNFYGLFVRYDGQFAFLESGTEPKPSNVTQFPKPFWSR